MQVSKEHTIWIHYLAVNSALNNDFNFVTRNIYIGSNKLPDWHGYGLPDKVFNDIGIYYQKYGNYTKSVSFVDFMTNQDPNSQHSIKYWEKRTQTI